MAYRLKSDDTPDTSNTSANTNNLIYTINVVISTVPDKEGNYYGEIIGDGVNLFGGTYDSPMEAYLRLWAWVYFYYESV